MKSLAKFKKATEKRGIPIGIPPIKHWLSFENLAMNWVCTGSFRRAVPSNRSVLIAGESGATKTMNVLQLVRKAQDDGYHCILLDSETSISEQDLEMNNVLTDEDNFTPIAISTHEETLELFTDALKSFSEDDKVMFVLDSINGLMTEGEGENTDNGKFTNDMGRIVQTNKKLLKAIGNKIRHRNWFFITTAHTYLNQDLKSGAGKYIISNLGSAMYYPSLTIQLTKLDLKEGQEQTGIRVNVTTRKNRFFQLGKKVRLELPYNQGGFDPYDGVQDILQSYGYIRQNGAWYAFDRIDEGTGEVLEEVKFQSKNFSKYAEELIARYEKEHVTDLLVEKEDDEASIEMIEHDKKVEE